MTWLCVMFASFRTFFFSDYFCHWDKQLCLSCGLTETAASTWWDWQAGPGIKGQVRNGRSKGNPDRGEGGKAARCPRSVGSPGRGQGLAAHDQF